MYVTQRSDPSGLQSQPSASLPRQMTFFLAEHPQQVQMLWVADCHSSVQDHGLHVVFVDDSFHTWHLGHMDLNKKTKQQLSCAKQSRIHTDLESTDHGINKNGVSQTEDCSGLMRHTLDLLADRSGGLRGKIKKSNHTAALFPEAQDSGVNRYLQI